MRFYCRGIKSGAFSAFEGVEGDLAAVKSAGDWEWEELALGLGEEGGGCGSIGQYGTA